MTALGVLCCFALFVCLTLLASFFLPSHLSLKKHVYNAPVYLCSSTKDMVQDSDGDISGHYNHLSHHVAGADWIYNHQW